MSRTRSRSTSVREDEELRLPRPPGVFRRFWARHPRVADVLIALVCLFLSLTPAMRINPDLPAPISVVMSVLLPLAVVGACVTLFWRRRAPLVPFLASFTVEAAFLFIDMPVGTPLVLATCYALAVYRSTAFAWKGFAIALASLAAFAGLLTLAGVISLQIAANSVVSSLVLGLIGTLIGVNVGGRKRYLAAVIDRSRQLLIERDQQAQLAAAAERARIAREMHDIVSHSLTVIVALSEGAAATSDPTQARAASTASAETARSALTEMRSMLGVLRADDDSLPLTPLEAPSPHDTVATAQRAGYPVSLTVTGTADLPLAVAHAASRIVQEGVTNAMRHAPALTSIVVRLVYETGCVTVDVTNDGAAVATESPGFGLRGLSERVAHVNGIITYGPSEGGRWVLHAEIPTDEMVERP
ncbi:sensor histidine kinase [Microbacterium saperdae]|uniref:sensor histidine kinase n=1 Tax=Microbacterium saperdae TaxID=69368 RepID=UPI0011517E50|nr:histidine kinase [Microbacterium saperdae]GGM56759.1 two-component sensor histidine kinase [Microbacterium saperdae]